MYAATFAKKLPQRAIIIRATEYISPTHKASATNMYSVSVPVFRVWSQWSNISKIGQMMEIAKARAAIACEIRARMSRIVAPHLCSEGQICEGEMALAQGLDPNRNGLFRFLAPLGRRTTQL